MEMNIEVSVIIPVYNAQLYLQQCLDSVMNQTLKNIEIICVDDGSTDSSLSILNENAAKDSRIRVLHQKNQYAGCARNNGMAQARGKYLVFWDADDFFEETALEKMYLQCEKDQADLCVCGARRMVNDSGRSYVSKVYLRKDMIPETVPFSRIDIPGFIFNFTTNVPWNKMFLRRFVTDQGLAFQEIAQANDVYFSMMALFFCQRITVVSEPLITYRMDNMSSLTGKASSMHDCTVLALRAVHERLLQEKEFDGDVRRSFANRAYHALLYSLRTQWDAACYKELYDLYKSKLLSEFEISEQGEGYLYSEKSSGEYDRMMRDNAEQFLLEDFRYYEKQYRSVGGQIKALTQEIKRLEQERDKIREKLQEKLHQKTERLNAVENSHAYKIGKKITWFPWKIKHLVKK